MNFDLKTPTTIATPKGHYTPGVVHNGIVYVSGQLPIDKDGQVQLGTIEEQTALCMYNVEQILISANSSLAHILKINIFVSNIATWPSINEAYRKIMGNHKPARIVVPCSELNYGCGIEIDCIAAVKL